MTSPAWTLTLAFAYINIARKIGKANWQTAWLKAAANAQGGWFGVNETLSPRQKWLYRKLAREHGWQYRGLWTGPNPIFFDPKRFTVWSFRQIKLHSRAKGRLAQRWIGFNSARYCSVLVLNPRPGGPLVTAMCWHLVPNGPKVNAKWRARMRARSIARLRAIIEHHRAAGRIVVGGGDDNLKVADDMDLGPHWEWIHPRGVDSDGFALPDGVKVATDPHQRPRVNADTFKAPIDHAHGINAELTLEAA